MKSIDESRKEINEIDSCLADLFEKRMMVCKDIALYKKEHNLPIFDEKREKEVILNNCNKLQNKDFEAYYISFLHAIMDISKDYQKNVIEDD